MSEILSALGATERESVYRSQREVQRWMRVPIERPTFPHVQAWFERLGSRPAFKNIVDIPLT